MKDTSIFINWTLLLMSILAGLAAYGILLAIGFIFNLDHRGNIYYPAIACIVSLVIYTFKLGQNEKKMFRDNYQAGTSKKPDTEPITYYRTFKEKKTLYFHIPFGLFVLAFGIYFLVNKEIAGIILLTVGIGFLYIAVQQKKTYIKLSKEGIWTHDFGFLYFKDLDRIEFHRFYGTTDAAYLKIYVKNNTLYKMKKPFLLQSVSACENRKELVNLLISKTAIPVTSYGI